MSMQGYSGSSYDKYVERKDTSTFHKMKETFWTTKQVVIQKLGKKEDEHVVASDAQLDAKLEVFKAIQKSCMELLRVIEKYQDRLCALSMEENATGRFLKSNSSQDKTRAGKMMAAVGKSQSFAAQQRLSLRVPLVRLYQEVETFRYRAISDTLMTINRMEGARTEYRGALLWMKDVSEQLDPDTYKQLEKFRKVQAQVKKTKSRFDKLKLDVMQKVDLLAASRCNMFSHVLANYQSSLLHFWEKTSRTMTAVAESFKGYQYYEFSIVKELQEPSKMLAEKTSMREPAERDTEDDFDPENFDSRYLYTDDSEEEEDSDLLMQDAVSMETHVERLISLDEESAEQMEKLEENSSLQNLYPRDTRDTKDTKDTKGISKVSGKLESKTAKEDEGSESFLDFGEDLMEDTADTIDEDLDFTGKFPPIEKRAPPKNIPKDLLSEDLSLEPDDTDKDDMTILNEILNAPSVAGEDDFSREWQAVFGHTPLSAGTTYTPGESDQSQNPADFMPSNLLEMSKQMTEMNLSQGGPVPAGNAGVPNAPTAASTGPAGASKPQPKQPQPKPKSKKSQKDMSAWFSLFADLDPLSDPDAIGKKSDDMTDA